MRYAVLLVVLCLASQTGFAQLEYIPDANFRSALTSLFGSCMVGDSLDTSCPGVVNAINVDFGGQGIEDFTGLEYFVSLTSVHINNNPLSSWPEFPNSLVGLTCANCGLTTIPNIPPNLTYLNCRVNSITSLPEFPVGFTHLLGEYNELTIIPELPASMQYLSCDENQLTSLPELDHTVIEELFCSNNLIDLMPEFPETLTRLHCSNNNLGYLPSLPNGIWALFCNGNNLTELPSLPDALENFQCGDNPISVLPELPDVLWELGCYETNINCLPTLPINLAVLEVGGSGITCVPNIPPNLETSFPICTSNNMHDCSYFRQITGKVFYDLNNDCQLQGGELGLRNRIIEADNGFTAVSDSNGIYELYLDTGDYSIVQYMPNNFWEEDCSSIPYTLSIYGAEDTISEIDFPNQAPQDCPWLWVDVAGSNHRPCFSINTFSVAYCNYGSAMVNNAYIDLTFPQEVIPISSTIPWQSLGNGLYRFAVGDLAIDACNNFHLIDSVSCEADVQSTVCITAEIFPLSPCLTGSPSWDNSSLEVAGTCTGSEVEFTIQNNGSSQMSAAATYRIFEDNAFLNSGTTDVLNTSETMNISMPANGRTIRLEVNQSIGHPGTSLPRAFVEGCGPEPFSFHQILPAYQNDVDDHTEISCIDLSAAYDPNDKRVVPSGYGPNRLVNPNDSLLEYTIRFQNTGNDTAFTIEVVDTLPTEFLNSVTFLSGSSSHPYTVRMHGNGIITWRFEDILLPDSNTNEIASHGFVKFKVRTRPGLPNGTVINNRANIYFDFNAAIVTNTSFITISDVPIIASLETLNALDAAFIYPNPTTGLVNFNWPSNGEGEEIVIFDIMGRAVFSMPYQPIIDVSVLPKGNYVLSVSTNESVHRHNLVVE